MKDRKSKQTKVSTQFRRETNPSKSCINNKITTFHIDASRKIYNTMYYCINHFNAILQFG